MHIDRLFDLLQLVEAVGENHLSDGVGPKAASNGSQLPSLTLNRLHSLFSVWKTQIDVSRNDVTVSECVLTASEIRFLLGHSLGNDLDMSADSSETVTESGNRLSPQ